MILLRSLVLAVLALVGLSVPPVLASDLSATRRALFEERRAIESISHRERIRILQEAEDCIQAAVDFREYRACERREKQAREALRERLEPRLQALRARVRAYRADQRRE